MLLRKTYRPKREKERERKRLTQKWAALNYSQNSMRVMVSRRMRWAGHMARMGKRDMHAGFWWGNLRERNESENLKVRR
jgi:hypothetical protein